MSHLHFCHSFSHKILGESQLPAIARRMHWRCLLIKTCGVGTGVLRIFPPKKSYNINIWSKCIYIYIYMYHYITLYSPVHNKVLILSHQVEGSLTTHASLFCSCTGQQALKPEFHRISNVLDQSWSNDCKSKWMIFAEHFTFGITIFAV